MAGDLLSSFQDGNSCQGKPLLLTRPVITVPERNELVDAPLDLCPLSSVYITVNLVEGRYTSALQILRNQGNKNI